MNSILIGINVMRRLLRELIALGFIFIFPVIAAVLSMLMFGGSEAIEIAITNPSENLTEIVDFLEKNHNYQVQVVEQQQMVEKVENKEINFGVILPEEINEESKVKLISRKMDEEAIKLKGILEGYLAEALAGKSPTINEVPEDPSKVHQQAKLAVGMISMFIIMFIGVGMQLLLEDKGGKTFMRSFCAPLREYEMALGHLLANLILGMLQIGIFLGVTRLIFKFDFGTDLFNVFILLLIFLVTAIGLGIGIVGFIEDGEKYNLVMMIVAVTMSFLGGTFYPLEFMNDFIRKLSNLMPQKWLMEAFDKLWGGGSLTGITNELLILLLFGFVFFTFGVKALKITPSDL